MIIIGLFYVTHYAVARFSSTRTRSTEQVWVFRGVPLRAIFRRPPVSGQKCCIVWSLYIGNIDAKEKGVARKFILFFRAIMVSHEVDLVAGDLKVPHGGIRQWQCQG